MGLSKSMAWERYVIHGVSDRHGSNVQAFNVLFSGSCFCHPRRPEQLLAVLRQPTMLSMDFNIPPQWMNLHPNAIQRVKAS